MPLSFIRGQSSVRRFAAFAFISLFLFSSLAAAMSSMQVPAVDANGNGILTTIQADVRDGSGGVYIDVEPFISVETQNSAKVAAQQAAKLAGVDLGKYDVFFKVIANTEVVDGPSGGQALGLLAYAEFKGMKIRTDLTATGSIEADGSIGKVGGILEKVEAAQAAGLRLVLLPLGQAVQSGVDLTQYAQARWGMQVVEVKNLNESVQLAFTPVGSSVDVPSHPEPALVLSDVTALQSERVLPLKALARTQVDGLKATLSSLNPDSVIAQVLRQAINRSSQLLENGYYYSAANEAFLARIQADAYALSNVSKAGLIQRVETLQADMDAYEFAQPTDTNLEWSAGARLRWFWAKERLAELKERAAVSERALSLLPDFAAAQNWFVATKQLDESARALGGNPVSMATWKAYAAQQLQAANRSVSANPVDSESLFHLKSGQSAFDAGDYLAAAYDAAFASAFNDARLTLSNAKENDLPGLLPKDENLARYADDAWAQLYYAHALYSAAQANSSGDLLDVINAVKLDALSTALARVNDGLDSRIGKPIEPIDVSSPSGIQITTTVQPAGPNPWILVGGAAVLVALVAGVLVLAYARRPKPLSKSDRLDLLEQGLLQGRISEKTYQSLSQKYSSDKAKKRKR